MIMVMHMYEWILTYERLLAAAEELKKRKNKPGYDKMTADAAAIWFNVNGSSLIEDIRKGRYHPMPASGFYTAKQGGGYRKLSSLTAIDAVLCTCIAQGLSEALDGTLSDSVFAYRPGRGVQAALMRYCRMAESFSYVSRVDPRACFDHINHDLLVEKLKLMLPDDSTLCGLIEQYIRQYVLAEDRVIHRREGILQGSPLSPLLCNLYFDSLDKALEEKGIPFIRYADDIVLFSKDAPSIERDTVFVKKYLTHELKLTVNDRKSIITSPMQLTFLGSRFTRSKDGIMVLDAEDSLEGAYSSWHESKPRRQHRIADIFSEGILRQKDYSLYFDTPGDDYNIPISSTDTINIYSSVIMDSGFFEKVSKSGIGVNFFDKHGQLLGRFTPQVPLKDSEANFAQLSAYYDASHRLILAREFVMASLHNCKFNLSYYARRSDDERFDAAVKEISVLMNKIQNCGSYNDLLLLEAAGKKQYLESYNLMADSDAFPFDKRTRRPPRNELNALISFGNTVLYNRIACMIYRSPLDIRVGYLHATTDKRMESLNLDIAEIFKPLLVDRVIVTIINKSMISPEQFRREENGGVYLSPEGASVFLKTFYQKLDTSVSVGGKSFTYEMLIEEEVRKLTRHFRHGEPYIAYRQVK